MAEREEAAIELLEGHAAFAQRATEMVAAAYTQLALLTQDLDRRIYGTAAFYDAARKFILQNPHTRFRLLVAHPQRAIGGGSRLIEFVRRMSSRMEFREINRARVPSVREEVLIADGRVMLYRESPEDLEAKYYGQSPHLARLRLKDYDALWNDSEPSQELRNLGI